MFTIVARFDAINPENKTNKIVIISTAKRSIIFTVSYTHLRAHET